MTFTLGPAMRVAVYSIILATIIGTSATVGWYGHAFFGAHAELSVVKSDEIVSSKLSKVEKERLDVIHKKEANFVDTSTCGTITFD